jgi:hypothetical protein
MIVGIASWGWFLIGILTSMLFYIQGHRHGFKLGMYKGAILTTERAIQMVRGERDAT